jgi:DHA1 family tetracycline resistance protein-like MFS transporter
VQGALASVQSLTAIFAPLIATNLFAWATDGTLPVLVPGLPFYVGACFLGLASLQAWRTLRKLER